jgi:hypothetical protein
MSQCDVCRSPGSAAKPLLRCAKCKVLWYCGKDCQVITLFLPRQPGLGVRIWGVCVTLQIALLIVRADVRSIPQALVVGESLKLTR